MNALLPIVYAGNIYYYRLLSQSPQALLEKHEHYIKQTFRNRCCIYGANGKLDLVIPIEKGKQGHQVMQDVKISYGHNWQRLHWKSLESAYRCSPYFEYYEHAFVPFYEKQYTYLVDFNIALQEKMVELLDLAPKTEFTAAYASAVEGATDYRQLAGNTAFAVNEAFAPYTQTFELKHGFMPNLSVYDLLFNCGPAASQYIAQP